jgi:hypothetical protein
MDKAYKNKFAIPVLFTSLCFFVMAACASNPNNTAGGVGDDSTTTSGTDETESGGLILIAWQNSPHANSFVMDAAGQNNTCSRCHAPTNWMPGLEDIPESCFTCKFEVDPPDPLIPEENWLDIPCYQCHEKDKKGNIQPEAKWLEVPAVFEEYAEVASSTELCQKCHDKVGFEGHGAVLVGGAHVGYGCTDCHDPHDTLASCGTDACHSDIDPTSSSTPGHDDDHLLVTCVACHDGAEMSLDFLEADGIFTTFDTVVTESGESTFPFSSHNIVLESSCDRCHYAGNPWHLTEDIGQP